MNTRLLMLSVVAGLTLTACAASREADMHTAELAAKQGDYTTARTHYEKLANFGMPEAAVELALLNSKGKAGKDPAAQKKAFNLIQKAAEGKDPRALFELGKLYQEGRGVRKDTKIASDLYHQALRTGYPRAGYQLGLLAESEKKYSDAEYLYRQALSAGYFKSALKIAGLYKYGRGRPMDLTEALAWYYFAQSHRVVEANDDVASLEKKLGPEKSAAARALSKGLL